MSVCVSVTFVDHVKTNKHIFEFFSPSCSHTILVFPHQTGGGDILTGTPLTGTSNASGIGRNGDSEPIFGFSACCSAATSQVLSTQSPVEHSQRTASCDTSLVVSGGVDCERKRNVYDKKPQRYAKDNRTAYLLNALFCCYVILIARSDKSVAYVTNNKRLYSTFCILVKLTTNRHEASCGLFATAELLVKPPS